ncbi:glycoside hydrolase family 6 protein [Cellulomonas sp. JZ18]|uniref:glycoside hydrolase family 6 protein n=1 Tax=Cellulomonas sp. JZ18 TaxID=2654191 RepID=UPI0018AFEE11|nr:glycoside hydrolase family 6 protein [Cellulomonas sp. JZ18]
MHRVLPRTTRLLTLATTVAATLLASVALAAPAHALTAPADRLTSGQQLAPGGVLRAVGSAHELAVQADGDVTLRLAGRVLWHTGTTGHAGARLVQQPSGALEVVTRTGAVVWSTGTAAPGARSVLKPEGVLYTIDTAHRVAWKSTVDGPALRTTGTDRVLSGGLLLPGESITSPDGTARLVMGTDGTLAVTTGGRTAWQVVTGRPGASATVTTGGELRVTAPDGTRAWSSGTASAGARLVLKDHARAYLVATTGEAVWSTPTPAPAPTTERVPAVVHLPLPEPLPRPSLPGSGSTLNGGSTLDGGTAERVHRTVLSSAPPYVAPSSPVAAAAQAARAAGRTADADLLDKAAAHVSTRWLGTADTTATVRAYADAARAARRTPVFVTYAIPDRDCGNHSAGGFATAAEYSAWVDAVAAGLAGARAVVVVEPDALLHLDRCGDRAERLALLKRSVRAYAAAGAEVYLDAGSSNSFGWGTASLQDMALRLRAAGVDSGAGFAVNTSNFQRSDHEVAYGTYLSALLGGAAFVVDTSRNGNGPLAGPEGTVWCNPAGRALGTPPGATGTGPHVANLWIKTVGLSDGTCNGGPAAGQVWEEYLLGLASAAAW